MEIQTFIEYQKIKNSTDYKGNRIGKEDPGKGGKVSNYIICNRTGQDFKVPLPLANNLIQMEKSPFSFGCGIEFKNYIMIAMDGQRQFRFQIDYFRFEEIKEHKNVIFVELHPEL